MHPTELKMWKKYTDEIREKKCFYKQVIVGIDVTFSLSFVMCVHVLIYTKDILYNQVLWTDKCTYIKGTLIIC